MRLRILWGNPWGFKSLRPHHAINTGSAGLVFKSNSANPLKVPGKLLGFKNLTYISLGNIFPPQIILHADPDPVMAKVVTYHLKSPFVKLANLLRRNTEINVLPKALPFGNGKFNSKAAGLRLERF